MHMASTPEVVHGLQQFWPWMLQAFGMSGTLLILCLAFLLCVACLSTPIVVWLLYRQGRRLEQHLAELQEWTASQNRQQQVNRIQRDRVRKKPNRRR
jgi:cytochrome c-type biogenesis protein CcmH/NrfG